MLGIRKEAVLAFITGKGWEGQGGEKAKLSDALKQVVDEDWKPLFTTLGDLVEDKAIHTVDLLDASSPQKAKSGGWDWKLEASGKARLEIDALDPQELDQLAVQAVPGQVVVRYTVAAEFGASAAGTQQAGVWNLGLSAGAKAAGQFDWLVSAPPATVLGQAVVQAIHQGDFVSPMNLADQLSRAGRSGYWGTCSRFSGTLSAGATVSANVAKTGWSWGLTGQREQIGFSLGVSGRASLTLGGSFELRVLPEARAAGWGLRVTLKRTRRTDKSLGVEVSAGADFSALARSAKDFLEARLPANTPLDPLASKLADAGSAVQGALLDRLTAALGDKKARDLVKLALGAPETDANTLAATLAQQLVGPLTDKLDETITQVDDLGGSVGDRVKAWLAGLLRQKDLPPALATAIDDGLGDATAKLKQHIGDLADQLEGKATAQILPLLAPFGALGEHVAQALQGLSNAVSRSDAVTAIESGLKQYHALRSKVLAVLGDAQRAKLVATIAVSVDESSSVETLFSALFVQADAAAEQLFAGLWRGHLDELLGLVAAARASGSVDDVSGWLLRSFERTRSESLSVTVLGYSFTQSQVSTTRLSVKSDSSGNILAVSGSALSESDTANYWTTRQASLGLTAKLLDPGLPTARATIELAGAFSVSGKVMKPRFLRSLQQSLGVPGEPGPGLRQLLETEATRHLDEKKFWSGVTFLLPLALDDVAWTLFASRTDDQVRRAVVTAAVACMNEAFRHDTAFGTPPMAYLEALGRERNSGDVTAGMVTYLGQLPNSRRLDTSTILKLDKLGFEGLPTLTETSDHQRARTTLRLGHLVRSIADLAILSRALKQTLADAAQRPEREVYEACRPLLGRMTTALEPVAVSALSFNGLGEDVPWPLVTFANAMAELSGRPRFLPLVTLTGAEDRPVPLLPE